MTSISCCFYLALSLAAQLSLVHFYFPALSFKQQLYFMSILLQSSPDLQKTFFAISSSQVLHCLRAACPRITELFVNAFLCKAALPPYPLQPRSGHAALLRSYDTHSQI